jgi:predicted transcriptional regulator
METERVSLDEAAKLLGMSKQGVREHMKNNLFPVPIGYVTNPSGKRNQYIIMRPMLEKCLGK